MSILLQPLMVPMSKVHGESCNSFEQVLRWLQMQKASESTIRLVQTASELSEEHRAEVLGNTLPLGHRVAFRALGQI